MIGRTKVRLRRAVAAVVVCGGVATLRPQSPPAGGRVAEATADAIADAKREFDALKSAGDATLFPSAGLPRLALPEIPAPAAGAGTANKPGKTPPARENSNWLVDAMAAETKRGDARKRGSRAVDAMHPSALDETEPGAREPHSESPSESEEKPGEALRVENPLLRYLGDWMTPQDYALLRPGLTDIFDGETQPQESVRFGTSSLTTVATNPNQAGIGILRLPSAVVLAVPRENPYLESLQPRPLIVPPAAPPTIMSPVARPGSAAVVIPPTAPPPRVPDFARPSADEKYFKQLKRF